MAGDLEILIAEQRRLLRELKELRGRVAAFESSRWWRLNPGVALRRFTSRRLVQTQTAVAPTVPSETLSNADDLAARFCQEVVARGAFRAHTMIPHITTWEPFLSELGGRGARFLEIGSFEGMSACYFLW